MSEYKVTIPIDERWESGIPHDPFSKKMMEFIADYDFHECSDFFCWKIGGDGDNGEQLMYLLDEYFAANPEIKTLRAQVRELGSRLTQQRRELCAEHDKDILELDRVRGVLKAALTELKALSPEAYERISEQALNPSGVKK